MCTAIYVQLHSYYLFFQVELDIFEGCQVFESLRMSPLTVLKTDTFKILSDLKVTEHTLC